nr:uncharacterized protein LOC129270310 [Lytechinus pictus]
MDCIKQSLKMIFQATCMYILAMFNMCESYELQTVMEGDTIDLYYPYPCNSSRITLQYGRRLPFYILEDAETITLLPAQAKRFTFTNEREDDNCLLFVRIKEVSRTDAGTYIFFAYTRDDVSESSSKSIGLHVDFLPGKASCKMNNDMIMEGDWVALDCIAPVGSISGWIDCYQNGEKMPSRTDPTETNKYLKQTILAKKKLPVFCCTSTWEHTRDICECTDFQWDLANNKNLISFIDPCGPTTTISDPNVRLTSKKDLLPSQIL